MTPVTKPRELLVHLRPDREGGRTAVRLLHGRSSYSGRAWWQVRVGSCDPIVLSSLEEAERAFDIVAAGGKLARGDVR